LGSVCATIAIALVVLALIIVVLSLAVSSHRWKPWCQQQSRRDKKMFHLCTFRPLMQANINIDSSLPHIYRQIRVSTSRVEITQYGGPAPITLIFSGKETP
jgi:hypothetical protein